MKEIEKNTLPNCDFCGKEAEYDAPTKYGSWAYMCRDCYRKYADMSKVHMGTKLKKRVLKVVKKPKKIKIVFVPLTWDSVAYVKCPYCGTERCVEPDANYTVTCEGCGNEYKVVSMI